MRTRALISVAIAWGASSCREGDVRDADLVEQSAALTWESNVTISGTYGVPAGSSLVVGPGVTVRFNPGAKLLVEGSLAATGVTFTRNTAAGWSGIEVRGAASAVDLDDVTIEYAALALSIEGSASSNTKRVTGSRIRHSAGACTTTDCPPFVRLAYTSHAEIVNNQIGTGDGWDGSYGLVLTRVDDSVIAGNVVNRVGRDGIVLGGAGYLGSSRNRLTANTVKGSGWQCYYLNTYAADNLLDDNVAEACGSAVDIWSAPGNTFVRLTIKDVPAAGFGIAPIGALMQGGGPAATTFEHLVFDGWESGAHLIGIGDNGCWFDPALSHTLIFRNVVFKNEATSTAVVYNRDGDHRFHGLGAEERRSTAPLTFAVADVDGDGDEDILTPSNEVPAGPPPGTGACGVPPSETSPHHAMDVLYNLGSEGFRRTGHKWELPWTSPTNLRFADFTGDGRTGVLAFLGNTYLAQVARGNGTSGFSSVGLWELPWTVDDRMRFADFTGDGRTDVLAFLGNTYLAQVAQSGGTGGFWNVGIWELPWTVDSRMRFADFTGDGKTDVLAYAGTNQAQVARSAGTSGFSNVGIWTLPSASFDAMRFFDDDRDGFADLILQVPSGFRVYRNLVGTGFSTTSTLYVTD